MQKTGKGKICMYGPRQNNGARRLATRLQSVPLSKFCVPSSMPWNILNVFERLFAICSTSYIYERKGKETQQFNLCCLYLRVAFSFTMWFLCFRSMFRWLVQSSEAFWKSSQHKISQTIQPPNRKKKHMTWRLSSESGDPFPDQEQNGTRYVCMPHSGRNMHIDLQ